MIEKSWLAKKYFVESCVNLKHNILHMYKVIFNTKVDYSIDDYITRYRRSFRELYSDTGIWSESIILDRYEEEAKTRKNEIITTIIDRLSGETVFWHSGLGTVTVRWRSKYLFIEYVELLEEKIRLVENIDIR